MSPNKQKRVYNLEYIQNIFRVIPLTFILILSIISIFITYVIIESKQNREIDLIHQKKILQNEFSKKAILLDFSSNVNKKVQGEVFKINKILQEHTYKIIGSLKRDIKENKFKSIGSYLNNYEQESNISVVLFKKDDLKIIYGKDKIEFLSKLIFGKYNKNYESIVLRYIYSQGRYNFQEWKNNFTGGFKVSFFDLLEVNGNEYFVGTFSRLENIKSITKSIIVKEIKEIKKTNDYFIWFFDLVSKSLYNFENKNSFKNSDLIISKNNSSLKHKILSCINSCEEPNKKYMNNVLFDNRNKISLVIDYDKNIYFTKYEIEKKYETLFFTITSYILLISILMIVFSLLFSRFTKKILDSYMKKLKEKTDLLNHWKNRFELAIIASNDGLWDIDFQTEVIYFSNKWLEISGYKKGEIKTFSQWFELIHSNEKQQVQNIFDDIFAGKRDDFLFEYRLKTKNEGFKWILGRGRLFLDKETSHKRMLMMSMDIDKSKRMKKELLDVELLVEDGKIVIFKLINDTNLTVKYISNAIKNYGYSKELFEQGKINFLDLIHKDDIVIIKNALVQALSKGLSNFTFVCRALTVKNEIRWISCRTIVLKDHFGNVSNFYGYINDITKIKLSEEELKFKVNKEVEKNREKDRILIQQSKLAAMGEMLESIAHQWRQPLNNISLFFQFIKDGYKNEKIDEKIINKYFDKSFSQIQYMSQTIDDFRNFYKPSIGKNYFDIMTPIESSLEIIKAQLHNQSIKLIINKENIKITNYENEFQQSLLNIFNNAIDAIKQKKAKEKFEAFIKIDVSKSKKYIEIAIENNADKIEDEIISRIFEPYFTTKFESQGTGVGLYMTKSIIEKNMQGKISVKNTKDGVCFFIQIPFDLKEKE